MQTELNSEPPFTDWSHVQVAKHDKELQALLGNLFMRITSSAITSRMATESSLSNNELFAPLAKATEDLPSVVAGFLDQMEVADALESIMDMLRIVRVLFIVALVALLSLYFQANRCLTDAAPWKASPEVARASYDSCLQALRVSGICLQPFIPRVAERLLDALGVAPADRSWNDTQAGSLGDIAVGVRLFPSKK